MHDRLKKPSLRHSGVLGTTALSVYPPQKAHKLPMVNKCGQLAAVPSLDSLAADTAQVKALSPAMAAALLLDVGRLEKALFLRALIREETSCEDRLLTVAEAADILRKTPDWLYRRAGKLPFVIREGRLLRFSHNGIQKYIQDGIGS